MTTAERASLLAKHCQTPEIESFLGYFAAVDLVQWINLELGSPDILDQFTPHGDGVESMALANSPILHILSGNTPHAGLQSLLRGLLIGARNIVKLPSSGLDIVENWIKTLPEPLQKLVSTATSLDDKTFASAKVVIAIGSDDTMTAIQARILPHQVFLPHGHKLSIGLINKPSIEAATLAVRDICSYNQQGCLSLHTIYVKNNAAEFLPMLADAMEHYESIHPRGEISLSESGAISNLRETTRYLAATEPEAYALEHSQGNTHWTAIYKSDPKLTPSPLNRVAYVQPWPESFNALGAETNYISTLAIHPKTDILDDISNLDIPRICPLGKSQSPSLFWHHDGLSPLHSLVRWRDIES